MPQDPRLAANGVVGFGSELRRLRTLAGLSQEALAARAGLSRRGIADLERGARRTPYPDTARRLAAALGLRGAERETFMTACRPAFDARAPRYVLAGESSPLIGRGGELAELVELLAASRLLTITGAGGIGKTRLALAVARIVEPNYADGAAVIDLSTVVDESGVPGAAAMALGLAPPGGEPVLEAVCRQLAGRQLLILIDNCEHLIGASARLVDTLLRGIPGLQILATSREALRLPGETAWIAPPLQRTDAVALFVARAGFVTSDGSPRADEAAVAAMCGHLEDLPLPIELAAVRVPALGIEQVAVHLGDRLAFLSRGNRLDPPRHQTLRAALDWSHALLAPAEQRLLARLAVFVGGWTLEGAEAVGAIDGTSAGAVLDDLNSLIDKSLVLADDVVGHRRFRYLETVREFALGQLEDLGETASARDRHAAYLLSILERNPVIRLGVPYPGDLERVRCEQANLQATLHWLRASGRLGDGVALCHALSGYWVGQGRLREGDEWWQQFLGSSNTSTEVISARRRAAGLHAWGRINQYLGRLARAQELFQASLEISVEHDDATVAARALCGLGDVALHRGAYDEAVDLVTQAYRWARSGGGETEVAQASRNLGRATALAGDLQESHRWLSEALVIERRLGDPWGIAYVLQSLGEQAVEADRLDEAQTLLEEALVLWRQAGTLMGRRAALLNLTLITLRRGAIGRGAELVGDVLDLSLELNDPGSATTVRAVEIAALVLAAQGRGLVSLRLVAFASAQREAIQAPRPAREQPEIDALISSVRELAGTEAEAEAIWSAGRGITPEQAIEEAVTALACVDG